MKYHRSQGDYEKIIQLLTPYQENLKFDQILLFSEALEKKGKISECLHFLTKVLEKFEKKPSPTEVRKKEKSLIEYKMGILFEKMAEKESAEKEVHIRDAISHLEASKTTLPSFKDPYEALLRIHEKKEQSSSFQVILNEMLTHLGENKSWYEKLCFSYYKDSYLELSLENCNQALKLRSKNPEVLLHKAFIYEKQGNDSKSEELFKKITTVSPDFGRGFFEYGVFLFKKELFENSLKHLKKAKDLGWSDYQMHLTFGQIHYKKENYEKALGHFSLAHKKESYLSSPIIKEHIQRLKRKGSPFFTRYQKALGIYD